MNDNTEDSVTQYFSEKEKLGMLENWFEQRTEMTAKAIKLILIPVIAVFVFTLTFWYSFYIPLPSIILLSLLGASILAWVLCLFGGGRILKRVRTGDAIMLRKIRSSGSQSES